MRWCSRGIRKYSGLERCSSVQSQEHYLGLLMCSSWTPTTIWTTGWDISNEPKLTGVLCDLVEAQGGEVELGVGFCSDVKEGLKAVSPQGLAEAEHWAGKLCAEPHKGKCKDSGVRASKSAGMLKGTWSEHGCFGGRSSWICRKGQSSINHLYGVTPTCTGRPSLAGFKRTLFQSNPI